MNNTQLETAKRTVARCIKDGGMPTIELPRGRVTWRGLNSVRIMEIAALNDEAHTAAVLDHMEARLK